MRRENYLPFLCLLLAASTSRGVLAQEDPGGSTNVLATTYDPSAEHPYGRLNPEAPVQTAQYAFLVGTFNCTLAYKAYRDGAWVLDREGSATWNAHYIMNGYAILDEFRDDRGATNVNVRVFDVERDAWLVHYTAANPAQGAHWEARFLDGKMVMTAERKTTSGYVYDERISFEPERADAYRWTQEVVYSASDSVVNGDIHCQRR